MPRPLRWLIAGLAVLWSATPIAFAVLSAFRDNREIFDWPPRLFFTPTLDHFRDLFRAWPAFTGTLVNSAAVTLGATALSTVCSLLAGYVYSRYRGRWLTASAQFLIVIRLMPPIIVTLPLFPLADWLGLSDTWTVLVLLYSAFFVSLGTMVVKTSIDTIPIELDDSALIDGASELQVLWRVIAPLSIHGLIAAAVFVVIFAWNDYLFAFVFTTSNAKTAPLILSEMMSSLTGVDWGVVFAAVTVQALPILCFVWLLQRWVVEGLTGGALKG